MNNYYNIKIGFAHYTNSKTGKTRPFLVFQDNEVNRVALWRITSKFITKSKYYQSRYFPIFHWLNYGLNKPSYVDINSQINLTISQYDSLKISKRPAISHLTKQDQIQFVEFLNRFK